MNWLRLQRDVSDNFKKPADANWQVFFFNLIFLDMNILV